MDVIAASTGWYVGFALGLVVIAVAAAIVITIVALARRIADAGAHRRRGRHGRAQTDELGGIARINDSGVRILHSARALRKVAVGK